MPNPENLTKHKWKKGQSGNLKGKPKALKTILKKEGLKQSQINDIISEMLAMNKDEIQSIIDNPKSKSFEVLIGQAIKKGVSKGDLTQIFGYALTRAFGSPRQETTISFEADYSGMSTEELIKRAAAVTKLDESKD